MASRTIHRLTSLLGTALLAAACGDVRSPDDDLVTIQSALVGDNLPGLVVSSSTLLPEARQAFADIETIADGVGPIFNERACGNCHTLGALGGAGENTERRFGTFTAAGFFDPLAQLGGTLRQLFTIGSFNNPNLPAASRGRCQPGNPTLCCVPAEVDPPQATITNVGRITTPLFGLGLVDTIPDAFFDGLAAAQPPAIRGIVNRVPVFLPNPGDPTQSVNSIRVGRFGWKAGIATLMQFSADAYSNEMAITTQHCFHGASINTFAIENAPNAPNGSFLDGCDDLAPRQPASFGPAIGLSSTLGQQIDDVVGVCTNGRTEIQDDVFLFTAFMTGLAPTTRDLTNAQAVARGAPLFASAGCAGCHVTTTFRTPANPFPVTIDAAGTESIRVPGNFAFNPYSDFLRHDMGALGDRIGDAPPDDPAQGSGNTLAQTRQMRTAPLWGIRFRNKLLHDGRTTDIATAIGQHDGQGAAARNAYNALSAVNQHDLLEFIRSL